MQEKFNKDLEEIKKSQSIMNNLITEIKSTLEGTNRGIIEVENRISEVEDRMVEINEAERKKDIRIKRNEGNLRDLWDNVKCTNIWIIGVSEEDLQPQIAVPSKDLIQIWRRNQKLYRQTKAKRIQHHKTTFTTNTKGNSLGKKSERREQKRKENRPTNIPQNNYENGSRNIYINDLLNANGLNVPTKRHRLAEWIQK